MKPQEQGKQVRSMLFRSPFFPMEKDYNKLNVCITEHL